ncbi:MAG: glycosyltransferase family 4 protein [Rickettsiales bacterium]
MNYKQPIILQVLPELNSGGVERGTVEIAEAIIKAGGKALVASAGGKMLKQLQKIGAEHIELPLASKNPFIMWLNSIRLASIIKKNDVDIIHARSRAPAWSAWLAAEKTGCHFLTTFHGTYNIQNKWKKKYNSIMVRGEKVIAVSNFIASHILENYEVDANKIRVIHRGVDLRIFNHEQHSPQRMVELATQWRLPEDLPLILFPGRFARWKGQEVFIKALAQIPHRDFFAVLLGNDKGHEKYREEIEQLIFDSDLAGNVRIANHTYYITEAYMLSKLVVATSIEPEAFGRVVLEAQAMGKPVIATRHGGPQETVIDKETGLLVEPNDVESLSKAINNVLNMSSDLQKQVERDAMENARQFSLDNMCEKTIGVYKEVLGLP